MRFWRSRGRPADSVRVRVKIGVGFRFERRSRYACHACASRIMSFQSLKG